MWTPDIILEQSAPILGHVPARDKEELVFLGLFLNVVGSFLSAGAFIVQKLTHNDESEVHMCCRWRWWLGFLMLLTSGILEGISLSYAPLSIVAPLSGLTVILNTIFAVVFLKETYRWIESVIVVLLAAGIGLTTSFGAHTQAKHMDAEYLSHLLFRDSMSYYYAGGFGLLIVLVFMIVSYQKCHQFKRLEAFGYATTASFFGAQQNMFLKCGFLMLKETLQGSKQYQHAFFWETVALAFVFAVSQITILNMGLSRHDAVSYIPVYQAALVVFGVVAGGYYFKEFDTLENTDLIGFVSGIGLIVSGLMAMTAVPPLDSDRDENDVEKGEKDPLKSVTQDPPNNGKKKQKDCASCCR